MCLIRPREMVLKIKRWTKKEYSNAQKLDQSSIKKSWLVLFLFLYILHTHTFYLFNIAYYRLCVELCLVWRGSFCRSYKAFAMYIIWLCSFLDLSVIEELLDSWYSLSGINKAYFGILFHSLLLSNLLERHTSHNIVNKVVNKFLIIEYFEGNTLLYLH